MRHDVPIQHPEFGKLFPCPECRPDATYKLERLRRFSRLTGDLAEVTFSNWEPRAGLQEVPGLVRAWFKGGKGWGWLTLSGPPGTGKSHLLAAIVHASVEAGRPAIYSTLAELLGDLRDTFQPRANISFSQLLADVEEADVLCLDEVEKINPTGWAEEQLFRLLESRYRRLHQTMTILATNVDLRDRSALLIESTRWPGYIEDRIFDGRNLVLTDFWKVGTFRPMMDVIELARGGHD